MYLHEKAGVPLLYFMIPNKEVEVKMSPRVQLGSHLPPRMGSAPWAAKSRPYKLSPSRIFCLHWVVGASWRTQSLTQGRGELGPGLGKHGRKGADLHGFG